MSVVSNVVANAESLKGAISRFLKTNRIFLSQNDGITHFQPTNLILGRIDLGKCISSFILLDCVRQKLALYCVIPSICDEKCNSSSKMPDFEARTLFMHLIEAIHFHFTVTAFPQATFVSSFL